MIIVYFVKSSSKLAPENVTISPPLTFPYLGLIEVSFAVFELVKVISLPVNSYTFPFRVSLGVH